MPDANAQPAVNQADFALVRGCPSCHGIQMTEPIRTRPPRGGGVLIALSILVGAIIGIATRQPSLGLVGGLTVGLLLAGLMAIVGRRS